MSAVAVDYWCDEHKLNPCKCVTKIAKFNTKGKYKAIPQIIDGIRFDSKKEAARYRELKLMEKQGLIRDIEVHPRFPLMPRGSEKAIGKYVADFAYYDQSVNPVEYVVEDCKGTDKAKNWKPGQRYGTISDLCKWKIKHFEAQYGIKVKLV